ncbi:MULTISPECIES: multicopper oxidase domain-containing protein [Deefgea]|uniref:multicopper oxidase domain-containing protein n=1 Tax=Deefgea TaxID=400947 RepID=UPI00194326E8
MRWKSERYSITRIWISISYPRYAIYCVGCQTERDAPYRARHDTINLRPYETIRIKTVQQDIGLRMFHCHILEYEVQGMMAQLLVK